MSYLTMMGDPRKEQVSSIDLSRERHWLSTMFLLGETGKYYSGSSKTSEPMLVDGGQFWRHSSSEDHPLPTCGGQSFKHLLFFFLKRKKIILTKQSTATLQCRCTISTSSLWFTHQDSCTSPCENAWPEDLLLPLTIIWLSSIRRERVSSAVALVTTGWAA